MTINNGDRKVAGNKLDAEADVLYYTNDSGCQYTFRPAAGSTVTLLRPTLTETAMTYTGGFGTDGVTTKGGDVTLTLTEGQNQQGWRRHLSGHHREEGRGSHHQQDRPHP